MKSFIKSSFLIILLIAVFSIDISNAYAKEVKTSEISSSERVNSVLFQCQIQTIANLGVIFDNSSQVNFNLVTILMDPTCEPATFRNGRYIIVVKSNCSVLRITLKKE